MLQELQESFAILSVYFQKCLLYIINNLAVNYNYNYNTYNLKHQLQLQLQLSKSQ